MVDVSRKHIRAKFWAKLKSVFMQVQGREVMRESIVQSLFNHFSVVDRDGFSRTYKRESDARSIRSVAGTLSDPQKGAVSANVAHSVAQLVLNWRDEKLAGMVASMLLQRLSGLDPLVDGAVMHALTVLIPLVNKETFSDIVKAFNDANKSLSSDSDMTSVVRGLLDLNDVYARLTARLFGHDLQVLTAHTHLAIAVAQRSEFHLDFLTEILSLFVHKGTHQPSRDYSKNAVSRYGKCVRSVLICYCYASRSAPKACSS